MLSQINVSWQLLLQTIMDSVASALTATLSWLNNKALMLISISFTSRRQAYAGLWRLQRLAVNNSKNLFVSCGFLLVSAAKHATYLNLFYYVCISESHRGVHRIFYLGRFARAWRAKIFFPPQVNSLPPHLFSHSTFKAVRK